MRNITMFFQPDSFDGIWACASMLHLPKADIPPLLENVFAVLRPGGIVHVSVKEGTGEMFDLDELYGGGFWKLYSFYEKEELLEFMRTAGL